jgi:hypothetical protein
MDPTAPLLVFTCDFDERTAFEVEQKDWFDATLVRLPNGAEVPVSFIDPVRLNQDLNACFSAGGVCFAEMGLIVIPKITRAYMLRAIQQLHDDGFFTR